MSGDSANVERARRGIDAFNRGEREGLLRFFHPELEIVDLPQVVEERTKRGLSGLERWLASMDEIWEELRIEPEEFIEPDEDHLLVVARFRGRGRGSGIEIDQRVNTVYTLREGRVVRMDTYPTTEEALAAIG